MRVGAALLTFCLAAPAAAECRPDRVEFRGEGTRAAFTVEIVDTVAERARGLMNRESLAAGQGMLFVYEAPGHPQFWMKNTLIPLDMIFIAPDGRVLKVHDQAIPLDLTPVDGGAGVQYVLEIGGGLAKRLGLRAGDEMRWPGLGDAAAWPCD